MGLRNTLREIAGNLDESMGIREREDRAVLSPVVQPKDVGRRPIRSVGRVEIDRVVADPHQPRVTFSEEAISRLAASIRDKGQLLPIHVRWDATLEKWVIISGERRWRAAREAGISTIDCVFHEAPLSAPEILEQQLIENLLREDLAPLEEARAFASLMELRGWNGKQLASALRITESRVSRALALLRLSEDVQAKVESGEIAPTTAYEISKIADGKRQQALVEKATVGKLTHKQAAKASRKGRIPLPAGQRGTKQTFVNEAGWKIVVSANKRGNYYEIEQALQDALEEVRHRIANGIQLF